MLWRLLIHHYYEMWPKCFLQQTQKVIEMAAFEECGLLGRELGHAGDYS
jgi:hypothetical protein